MNLLSKSFIASSAALAVAYATVLAPVSEEQKIANARTVAGCMVDNYAHYHAKKLRAGNVTPTSFEQSYARQRQESPIAREAHDITTTNCLKILPAARLRLNIGTFLSSDPKNHLSYVFDSYVNEEEAMKIFASADNLVRQKALSLEADHITAQTPEAP